MKNVNITVKNKKLIIEIDLNQSFGDSKSGKTEIIASTSGNRAIEEGSDICIGLNVYRKNKK